MSDLAPILQSFFTDRMITQQLDLGQLDADLITSFLRWLDTTRSNSPRTRNARLSAIRSLFSYAALRAPDNAATIQRVRAIEASRVDTTVVSWLTDIEAPFLVVNSGLSSRPWLGCSASHSRSAAMVRASMGVQRSSQACPSLTDKNLTPHTLRHSTAMHLRHAGVDNAVIALWLGHQDIRSTQVYTHADLKLKEKALDRTTPPDVPSGRYQPSDQLLAFLDTL